MVSIHLSQIQALSNIVLLLSVGKLMRIEDLRAGLSIKESYLLSLI
jgi:hypothetical protein